LNLDIYLTVEIGKVYVFKDSPLVVILAELTIE